MGYISAVSIQFTNVADQITFNYFHVAEVLCAVVDKIHQGEMKKLPSSYRKSTYH